MSELLAHDSLRAGTALANVHMFFENSNLRKFGEDLRKRETYYDLVEAWKYPMRGSPMGSGSAR